MATAAPYVFSSEAHSHIVLYLAALHGSCINHDKMLGTFLPPLNHEKLLLWWKDRVAEVHAGTRMMLLLLEESEPGSRAKPEEVKGVVMLALPTAESSAHCAAIEWLLIKPDYRGRGGARILMTALEFEAARRGKTLLRMEVESGSAAVHVFTKFGYQEAGRIPAYCILPSGEKRDQIILFKQM